jgi:hypothetical protein
LALDLGRDVFVLEIPLAKDQQVKLEEIPAELKPLLNRQVLKLGFVQSR